jgi:acetyl-CoA carboxylase carboxyltransferase component
MIPTLDHQELVESPGMAAPNRDPVNGTTSPSTRPVPRLTVQQRLRFLLDHRSFHELWADRRSPDGVAGDGVITGVGQINGERVCVFAQNAAVCGGSIGQVHAEKIAHLVVKAAEWGIPIIGLYDGGGARIQEGMGSLDGCGRLFKAIVDASGKIPQVSVILGACAGAAAYAPALTDFTFMVQNQGMMYLTGPTIVEAVTGESITGQELGGADHASAAGVADFVYPDEVSCLQEVRYLLSLLPRNQRRRPPSYSSDDSTDRPCPELLTIVPPQAAIPYNMHEVIAVILDLGSGLEVASNWAGSVLTYLGRLDGHTVGILANQPTRRAGCLDIDSAQKSQRFVRRCDTFGIPLISLVDVPGFLPGTEQEHGGVIRHGAGMLAAYCSATIPRVQVILRKAYGGAYIVMDSLSVGSDVTLAWPTNEIAVMGAMGAVEILHRTDLSAADDREALAKTLQQNYSEKFLNPAIAAEMGIVHAVIDPSDTRRALIEALEWTRDKRRDAPPGTQNWW